MFITISIIIIEIMIMIMYTRGLPQPCPGTQDLTSLSFLVVVCCAVLFSCMLMCVWCICIYIYTYICIYIYIHTHSHVYICIHIYIYIYIYVYLRLFVCRCFFTQDLTSFQWHGPANPAAACDATTVRSLKL